MSKSLSALLFFLAMEASALDVNDVNACGELHAKK